MIRNESLQRNRFLSTLKESIIIYYFNTQDLPAQLNESLLLPNLSVNDQVYLSTITHTNTRINSLIGRIILRYIGNEIDHTKSLKIEISSTGKPYFPVFPSVHFNISHSKQMVVCALCLDQPLGIDIEFNEPIVLESFEPYFQKSEWNLITSSTHPLRSFYALWTRKEALIKANGRGMEMNLKSINTLNEVANIEGTSYHLQNINLVKNYSTAIASPSIKPIQLIKFKIPSNIVSGCKAYNTCGAWN